MMKHLAFLCLVFLSIISCRKYDEIPPICNEGEFYNFTQQLGAPCTPATIIPTVSSFDLYIWECIGQNCKWDGPYAVAPNSHYKVMDGGNQ